MSSYTVSLFKLTCETSSEYVHHNGKKGKYLVGVEEMAQIFLQDTPFSLEILDVPGDRLRCDKVVEFIALPEVKLDKPSREHHPLCQILIPRSVGIHEREDRQGLTVFRVRSNLEMRYARSESRSPTSKSLRTTSSNGADEWA